MGIEIADAYVSIKPSAKGLLGALKADLAGLELAAQQEGDRAGKSFGQKFTAATGTSLDALGKTALKGFAAASLAIYGTANAAGDLEAAISANEQVLGGLSKGVQEWAKSSVENFGLSERAAVDAATSFGAIGKVAELSGQPLATFSQDLVGLAADMAAFANVPVAQTLQDLQGGFAGQTEVLRKYNVYLDDAGLKQAYLDATGQQVSGTLTAQQRIIATNAELWRQTADQQGQAAREADGFARAQDNFKATLENAAASIGATALPAVTALLGGITSGIGLVGDFNDATGGLVGQLLLMTGAGLGTVGVLATVGGKVSNVIDNFKDMSTAAQKFTVGAGLAVAAVTIGLAIYDSMGAKQREVAARTKELAAALPAATKEMWQLAESSASASGDIAGVAVAEKALSKVLTTTGEDGERLTIAMGQLGLQSEDAVAVLRSFKDDPVKAMKELAMAQGLTEEQAVALAKAVDSTDTSMSNISGSNISAQKSLEQLALAATGSIDGFDGIAGSLEEMQDQAENTDFKAIAEKQLALAAASNEAAAALVEQAQAAADAAGTGGDAYAVWTEYERLLGEMPDSQRDVVLGTEDVTSATKDLSTVQAKSVEITTEAEDAFAAAADQADAFKQALDQLIGGQLGLQAAQDALTEGTQALDARINELRESGELGTDALEANTEAGLANRAMIRDQVDAALALGSQMIDTGASVTEASDAILGQRGVLIGQLEQFGFTREAAEAYVDQLGLTPANVQTAVELAGTEAAKQGLQVVLDQLTDIDAGAAAEVQALIDEGSFAAAEYRLKLLTGERRVLISPRVATSTASAWGNYFDRPGFTSIAEDGDPEAVLTLGKPANLAHQLTDPRISGPIMEALNLTVEPMSAPSGPSGPMFGDVTINSDVDADAFFRLASFHMQAFS